MTNHLKRVPDSAEGLAFEHTLFTAPDMRLGIWTAEEKSLVCPRAYQTRAGFDDALRASAARGWPVFQRPTGGGAVPQGPGINNLVLAFNAPQGFTIDDGYRVLVDILKTGLGEPGDALETGATPGSFCDGAWNLSVTGKKLVGTAQRWRPVRGGRPRVLAHAMILTTHDTQPGAEAVSAFHQDLGMPPVQADAHTNLQSAFGLSDLPHAALVAAARSALETLRPQDT